MDFENILIRILMGTNKNPLWIKDPEQQLFGVLILALDPLGLFQMKMFQI